MKLKPEIQLAYVQSKYPGWHSMMQVNSFPELLDLLFDKKMAKKLMPKATEGHVLTKVLDLYRLTFETQEEYDSSLQSHIKLLDIEIHQDEEDGEWRYTAISLADKKKTMEKFNLLSLTLADRIREACKEAYEV